MGDPKIFEVLAEAFAAEGITHHFTLMGNGNMYWADALAKRHQIKNIHARHEHCAVAMADGYFRATGRVSVASVTCGPGFTQVATALAMAARANIPMVLFAGDAPMNLPFHIHQFDQGPLAASVGAKFISVRSKERMLNDVREAFYVAQTQRVPVVLSVPEDFQQQTFPYVTDYHPSASMLPTPQRPAPSLELVERAAEMIAAAKCPIIIGGRGAVRSGARTAIENLADQCGALLATTLYSIGLFDKHPFGIGIAGAFASNLGRELFAEADLVIGIGAILGNYTTEGGYLYPNARAIHLDLEPRGISEGVRVADLQIRADAKAGAEALLGALKAGGLSGKGARTEELKKRIAAEVFDRKEFAVADGVVDPRKAFLELDKVIPPDWDIVAEGGHTMNFAMTHMRNRDAERIHVINSFGAIGSALPAAIGVAVARGDGKVALVSGDGSLLMHIQELETLKRHGIRLLMCIMNDGGYGAEAHKFRAHGMDPSEAIHGRGDLAAVARGFGLRGTTVRTLGTLDKLFEGHHGANQSELWDIHIADDIPSVQYRRMYFGEH